MKLVQCHVLVFSDYSVAVSATRSGFLWKHAPPVVPATDGKASTAMRTPASIVHHTTNSKQAENVCRVNRLTGHRAGTSCVLT